MLTSTLPRWEGDSEPRFVLDLAKQLSDDFEIEILAPHTQDAATSEILEGIPVTRFRYWFPRWESVAYQGGITWRLRENRARILQIPFFLVSLAWNIFRRLRSEPRLDLIHAHWLIPQGLIAVLARGFGARRIPVVTTSHGGDLFGLQGKIWTFLKRKVLQDSNAVTVVSQVMAKVAQATCVGVDPAVIPMGTDLYGRFTPPAIARSRKTKKLIFVGRLVEKKGVKYLLEALALVTQKHPEVSLQIVGHGPLRAALEADVKRLGIGNAVSFVGPVPHQQLPLHYQAADIAVFPFVEATGGDQEGFGLVMVEAMGTGCAVIASGLPAVRDVIDDGVTGKLVPPADPRELESAINFAIENPEVTLAMATVAREYALHNFDWRVTKGKFKHIFDVALRN